MSILIKGMEMPTSCNDCPLAGDFKCNLMPSIPALCKEYDMAVQNGKRLNNCPLVEIPPLAETVKVVRCKDCAMANADSDERYMYCTKCHEYKPIDYYCAEGRHPDEVEGRKQGKWIDCPRCGDWVYARCSECGTVHDVQSNFCPTCGADMREES